MVFWRKKDTSKPAKNDPYADFERAKQAVRYASFISSVQLETAADENGRKSAQNLFDFCRSHALVAGAALNCTASQVDELISKLVEEDATYLQNASDEQVSAFVRQAGKVVNTFLAETRSR